MIDNPKESVNSVETALASLQPIRDLAKNWDIDIAAWYDLVFISVQVVGEFELAMFDGEIDFITAWKGS